ncbi:MAG: helix-turn-helix transcriptional regulator [Spirochaetes bacterium]|nr:helix-turn-helix transcriptional regulator [Spirochaetota bacterium]
MKKKLPLSDTRGGYPQSLTLQSIAYKEQGLKYHVGLHTQKEWQWYCVVYGSVSMTHNGNVHRLTPGTSILIPPGDERSPQCAGKAPGYIVAQFINRSCALESISGTRSAITSDLLPELHALVDELKNPSRVNSSELVLALFSRIIIGQERNTAGGVVRQKVKTSGINPKRKEDIAARIDHFLETRMHTKVDRNEIAAAFGISPTHCARLYRETRGITLHERLTALRIAEAKHLLLMSTQSISDIAFEIGFDSISHFTRLFRAEVGASPSDYRRSGGHVYGG